MTSIAGSGYTHSVGEIISTKCDILMKVLNRK